MLAGAARGEMGSKGGGGPVRLSVDQLTDLSPKTSLKVLSVSEADLVLKQILKLTHSMLQNQ